jgi:hypothetical protein
LHFKKIEKSYKDYSWNIKLLLQWRGVGERGHGFLPKKVKFDHFFKKGYNAILGKRKESYLWLKL